MYLSSAVPALFDDLRDLTKNKKKDIRFKWLLGELTPGGCLEHVLAQDTRWHVSLAIAFGFYDAIDNTQKSDKIKKEFKSCVARMLGVVFARTMAISETRSSSNNRSSSGVFAIPPASRKRSLSIDRTRARVRAKKPTSII